MSVHAIIETIRNALGIIPLPLWISVALLSLLLGKFIEARTLTRWVLWMILSVMLFIILYFG